MVALAITCTDSRSWKSQFLLTVKNRRTTWSTVCLDVADGGGSTDNWRGHEFRYNNKHYVEETQQLGYGETVHCSWTEHQRTGGEEATKP